MNRRVPNGTHGGVRGRGNNISPPTRLLIHIDKENEDHEKRVYYYVILQV